MLMYLFNTQLLTGFKFKKVVKIISGLNNFNLVNILKVVKAPELSQASYIDFAANTKLVRILRSMTSLPICVSSISPTELYNCVVSGANLVEIGNFDCYYKNNIFFQVNNFLN